MLNLLGPKKNWETLAVLSKPFIKGEVTRNSLEEAYYQFLKRWQPTLPVPRANGTTIVIDQELEKALVQHFRIDTPLNDKNQTKVIGQELSSVNELKFLQRQLEEIQSSYPEWHSLFSFVINFIFCAPSTVAHAGSTSAGIGIIWVREPSRVSKEDLIELLVHELTHNLMFLDEARNPHYITPDSIDDKRYYVTSAILKVPRPIDKVIHSLAVGTEIWLHRRKHGRKPRQSKIHLDSKTIAEQCLQTADELIALQKRAPILASRGLEIVQLCREAIERHSDCHSGEPGVARKVG